MKTTFVRLFSVLLAGFVSAVAPAAELTSDNKTPKLVLPFAVLDDLSSQTLAARLRGDHFDDDGVEATFFNRQELRDANNVLTNVTYQLHVLDASHVKVVDVVLTQGADGVYGQLAAGYHGYYSDSFADFGLVPFEKNPRASQYHPYDFRLFPPASAVSVNFTHASLNLASTSSVRYGGGAYAVPYSAWNNMPGANGSATFGDVKVTVSGTRGSYMCSWLNSGTDPRYGYIDDNNANPTPTIRIEGIPYAAYRVVVYAATETADCSFGHVTVNGTDYTGATDGTVRGTAVWGNTGASHKAKGLREGVNYLVSDVHTGSTATIIGHRNADLNARGCIAAVQIVECATVKTATIANDGDFSFADLSWRESVDESLSGNAIVINVNANATLDLSDALAADRVAFNVADGKTLTITGKGVFASQITVNGVGHVIAAGTDVLRGRIGGSGNVVIPDESALSDFTSFGGIRWICGTDERAAVGIVGTNAVRSLVGRVPPIGLAGAESWLVTLDESRAEFGNGLLSVTGIPETVSAIRVTRPDGTTTNLTPSAGTATLADGVKIDGAATLFDVTFKNNREATNNLTYTAVESASLSYDSTATFNNDAWDDTTGVYIKHHPYVHNVDDALISLRDFTAVVVGTVSPTPSRQFIHLGASHSGAQGLLIATTENPDEILIAANAGNSVDVAGGVKATVPNAATARHAFVIVRTGNTFNVWVDGVKRGVFSVPDDFILGRKTESTLNSGIQVGSDFGGLIKGAGTYKGVANAESETGVVNVIRVFDYAISEAQAETIVKAYPYVSQGGLFTRTVTADGTLSQEETWTKSADDGAYALPEGATVDGVSYKPSATLSVAAASCIEVNANLAVETLTVGGSAAVSFVSDGVHAMTAGAAVFNSPVTNKYGALNLSAATVQLGSSGSLAFDCSAFEMPDVWMQTQTRVQLTGLIDRDDERVTLAAAPEATYLSATLAYNETGSCYDLVLTPTGPGVWIGAVDGDLTNPGNWGDGKLPAAGAVVVIGGRAAVTLTVPEGGVFSPSSITFPAGSAKVTIAGDGEITGVAAITNLSSVSHEITVPVRFADKISVVQGAKSWASRTNPSVRFGGGAYGTTMDAAASHFINGHYFLSDADGISAHEYDGDVRYGMTDGSSLSAPQVTTLAEIALGEPDRVVGCAVTTGVFRTSTRLGYLNNGEFVVTNEVIVTLPNDLYLTYTGSVGDYKFEKMTLGDEGNSKWLRFKAQDGRYYDKNISIGAGGFNFAADVSDNTCYVFALSGDGDDSRYVVRPWHADYTMAGKTGDDVVKDYVIERAVRFGTTDENGVPRTVTLDGKFSRGGAVEIFGDGRFIVNSVSTSSVRPYTGNVAVTNAATLAVNPGMKLTYGTITVHEGATLEVAGSGTVALAGGLALARGANLAFNFTARGAVPVLDLTDRTVSSADGEATSLKVKITSDVGRPSGLRKILTAGGGFAGVDVTLAGGAPEWAESLYVDGDGNLVLELKPLPFALFIQ